jgi:hypothetical protein
MYWLRITTCKLLRNLMVVGMDRLSWKFNQVS